MTKNQEKPLTMAGNIDGEAFMRFACFNAFVRNRAWRNPAIFAGIMVSFAIVCFIAGKTRSQGTLLGAVLLAVGIVLPVVWFALFFQSVKRQVKINGLSSTKAQYFVTLAPDEIRVAKGEERAQYSWDEVHMAYRVKGCIYLYVTPQQAYLMPDCADTENAWSLITSQLPAEKVLAKVPV